jgi:hypothetical protein
MLKNVNIPIKNLSDFRISNAFDDFFSLKDFFPQQKAFLHPEGTVRARLPIGAPLPRISSCLTHLP